ncbi:putative multidrug and toxin extrusion protein 2-like [Capsicum annuum]|nr:putative multidrug and toxin extrusion protein 2-like [Capsicum annuum]KAF3627164.1 putative multidrug and toxin extrusion protein 2-like [Capsicum annuum]
MDYEPNSWKIFKKLHQKKVGRFVDTKSKSINGSTDNSSKDQELDINRKYFDIVGGAKKRVYGLGSEALTLHKDMTCNLPIASDHVAEKRIKIYRGATTSRARGFPFEATKR